MTLTVTKNPTRNLREAMLALFCAVVSHLDLSLDPTRRKRPPRAVVYTSPVTREISEMGSTSLWHVSPFCINYYRWVFLAVVKAGQATVLSHHRRTKLTSMALEWIRPSTRDRVKTILKVMSVCATARIRRGRTDLDLEETLGWISVEVNISLLHPF